MRFIIQLVLITSTFCLSVFAENEPIPDRKDYKIECKYNLTDQMYKTMDIFKQQDLRAPFWAVFKAWGCSLDRLSGPYAPNAIIQNMPDPVYSGAYYNQVQPYLTIPGWPTNAGSPGWPTNSSSPNYGYGARVFPGYPMQGGMGPRFKNGFPHFRAGQGGHGGQQRRHPIQSMTYNAPQFPMSPQY